jgi:transcriptional regulator with XRE-family HTH domain
MSIWESPCWEKNFAWLSRFGIINSEGGDEMASLEERLRLLREKRGLKQKEVAARLGLSPNTLSRYETGERVPDYKTLVQLAEFYQVTADYLLTGKMGSDSNGNGNGHSQPWWERNEPPDEIEFEEFIRTHNIRLKGDPLGEKNKEDMILIFHAAWEAIKQKEKAAKAARKEG